MILAVLADVHGNAPALEAVLADAYGQGATQFLVAGDLLTGAPFPVETLARLRGLDAILIRGNVDQYLLDYERGVGAPVLNTAARWAPTRWTHNRIGSEGLVFLEGLPEQAVVALPGTASIRIVHGSPSRIQAGLFSDQDPGAMAVFQRAGLWPSDQVPPVLEQILADLGEQVLVCGHTHVPWQQAIGQGRLACNPGSVGFSINGDPCAQYLLLQWESDGWKAELRAVAYDLHSVRQAFADTGLLEEGGAYARACLANLLTGENAAYFLIQRWLEQIKAQGDDSPAGQELAWQIAVETFTWSSYGV